MPVHRNQRLLLKHPIGINVWTALAYCKHCMTLWSRCSICRAVYPALRSTRGFHAPQSHRSDDAQPDPRRIRLPSGPLHLQSVRIGGQVRSTSGFVYFHVSREEYPHPGPAVQAHLYDGISAIDSDTFHLPYRRTDLPGPHSYRRVHIPAFLVSVGRSVL